MRDLSQGQVGGLKTQYVLKPNRQAERRKYETTKI